MKRILYLIITAFITTTATAANIDLENTGKKYAWGENVGWLNFKPSAGPGVQVYRDRVEGFVWSENIGWINLSPASYGGVINDGTGKLSGYAWGENVGWINFNPEVPGNNNSFGVQIDSDGNFSGYAWGENIGWVNFGLVANCVHVGIVNMEDLAIFSSSWLEKVKRSHPANFNGDSIIDLYDFAVMAANWLDYCPADWKLK
ncbi:MAG: hypothetical protein JW745_00375 [Sedimentisphaerales bacterium]|nr:hypothetical protein [Sedimentisphaerales bacterium]MBN2844323.1 hypothetical protein [Sedimentisphaerales bacterium]